MVALTSGLRTQDVTLEPKFNSLGTNKTPRIFVLYLEHIMSQDYRGSAMGANRELGKLAELRQKTDRQLLGLVADDLQSGFTLAKVAEAHSALGDFVAGQRVYRRARRACDESRLLLPLLATLDEDESRRLEQQMYRLEARLKSLARCFDLLEHRTCCA